MSDHSAAGKAASVSRKLAYAFAFSAGFLAVGWSVYWYVAHRLALGELEATLAREARQGRAWSCDSTTSGGYPFSIEIDCDRFSVSADIDSGRIVARARRAVVVAPLHTPKRVFIRVDSPADVSIGNARVDLDWRSLQLSARGLPGRWDRLSAIVSDAVVGLNGNPTRIAALQSNLRRPASATESILNYEISAAGIESTILNAALGSPDLALLASAGAISQFDRALATAPGERLEQWRAAGGRLNIAQLSFLKGRLGLQAEGGLGLDQSRRIDGKLDLRIQNAAETIANLGRQSGSLGFPLAGLLFGALLTDRQTGETRLSISVENGRLGVGPMKNLMTLPPLY